MAIDGLRGFLALWVFCFHFDEQYKTEMISSAQSIHKFFTYGWIGVEIFFSVSGFLIFRSYSQLESLKKKKTELRFYVRRIFRIWPVWFVALSLYALFENDMTISKFLWNFFFLFGFHPYRLTDLMVYVSWSLFTEEVFYLCFPLIFRIVKLGAFMPLLALSFLGLGFWRNFSHRLIPMGYRWSTPLDSFSCFFIGIGFALMVPHLTKYTKNIRNAAVIDITIFGFFMTLLSFGEIYQSQVFSATLLFCVLQIKGIFHWIFKNVFSFWGPRCFCIYLIHPFALDRVNFLRWHFVFINITDYPRINLILQFSLATFFTLLFAEFLHRVIELPTQILGRKISEF